PARDTTEPPVHMKRPRAHRLHLAAAALVAAAVATPLALAASTGHLVAHAAKSKQTVSAAAVPAGQWLGFGRTPDENRHTPLTQVTPANVAQLKRDYT